MSETANQNTLEMDGTTTTDNDDHATPLKIDSIGDDTPDELPGFISPRTLILESKSSEEEMTVSTKRVASIRKRFSGGRHSLPANTGSMTSQDSTINSKPSRSSLGGGGGGGGGSNNANNNDDVLARARAAIEGRKKSRETAKAKVDAALASIADNEADDISSSIGIGCSTSISLKPDESADVDADTNIASTSHVPPVLKQEASEIAADVVPQPGAEDENVKQTDKSKDEKMTSPAGKGEDIRAKARARLNNTMALLAGRSPARKKASSVTSPPPKKKKEDVESKKEIKDDDDKFEGVENSTSCDTAELLANEQTIKVGHDVPKQAAAMKGQADSQVASPKSGISKQMDRQESLEAKLAAKQAELEDKKVAAKLAELEEKRRLGEQLGVSVSPNEEQWREDQDTSTTVVVRAKAEKLRRERLANEAAKQAELEARIERERAVARRREKEEEKARPWAADEERVETLEPGRVMSRAATESLERDRLELALAAKQAELEQRMAQRTRANKNEVEEEEVADEGAEDQYDESTQASMSFDPILDNTSSCSTSSLLDKPSKSSDATSLGQVDRMLYQGKATGNDLQPDDDDSEEDIDADFEPISNSESGSQASVLNNNDGDMAVPATKPMYTKQISDGPMWKRAAEEAAFRTALNKDLMPREQGVPSMVEEERLIDFDHDPKPLMMANLDPSTATTTNNNNDLTTTRKSLLHGDEASYLNLNYHNEDRDVWMDEAPNAESQDEEMGLGEWKGFKRDRMICMVAFGILAGLFPSLYVLNSCHFITGDVTVGDEEEEFGLRYGLHKFTPVDSAFQGHSYCEAYNSKYNYHPPKVPQVFGAMATIFGTIPLVVIGVYIRYTMTHKLLWVGSMWMLYAAFVCQLSTLSMLLMDLCTGGIECSMGPGARASVLCALVWFVMSVEMKVNSPLIQPVDTSDGVVVIERDYLFISMMKKAWRMINEMINPEVYKSKAPSLSKAAMKKKKGRIGKGEAEMAANYRPPDIV